MISTIQIDFQIPVELEGDEQVALSKFVQRVCDRHCPEGWVYWQSGVGALPNFSQADCFFLGKPVDPNAPESGEPTFDDSVFHLDTSAREARPEELERHAKAAKAKAERRKRFWFQVGLMVENLGLWIRRHS